MSIDEDEIRQYLENKKLKDITLPQNSNDIDQGSDSPKAEEKIGQKNLEAKQDLEKRFAWMDYIRERDKKMQYGDKQAIAEYMAEVEERRQRLEEQKYQSRLEYDFRQEEKARLAKEAKITPEERELEKSDIEKLERKRDKEIANIQDYFNCSEEEWQEYLNDHHEPEESPANVLIGNGPIGFVCKLHRYKHDACSAITIEPIEDHFRKYEPEMHKQAIIDTINEKYDKLIQERKEKTLEDKDVAFKKELRQIEKIKTRVDGDWPSAGTKLTKGQKARIREAEESEDEKNRRIYRGLY
jgi:hypothetical protein